MLSNFASELRIVQKKTFEKLQQANWNNFFFRQGSEFSDGLNIF